VSGQIKASAGSFELTTCCQNPHWRPKELLMEHQFFSALDLIGHVLGDIQMDAKAGNDWDLGRLWEIWPHMPFGKNHDLMFASPTDSSSHSASNDGWWRMVTSKCWSFAMCVCSFVLLVAADVSCCPLVFWLGHQVWFHDSVAIFVGSIGACECSSGGRKEVANVFLAIASCAGAAVLDVRRKRNP
jgi:hypothetical protein